MYICPKYNSALKAMGLSYRLVLNSSPFARLPSILLDVKLPILKPNPLIEEGVHRRLWPMYQWSPKLLYLRTLRKNVQAGGHQKHFYNDAIKTTDLRHLLLIPLD